MSSGPENKFRKKVVTALKKHFGAGVYIQKNHGSAYSSGLVDMEVILRGQAGFYELKASKGPLNPACVTALQLVTLKAIDAAGGRAYVLHCNTSEGTVGLYRVQALADPQPICSVVGALPLILADPLAMRVMLAI